MAWPRLLCRFSGIGRRDSISRGAKSGETVVLLVAVLKTCGEDSDGNSFCGNEYET